MPFSIHPAFSNLASTTLSVQSLVCEEPHQAPENLTCLPGVEDSALALSYVQALRSARAPLHPLSTLPEQSRNQGPIDGTDAGASLEASFQEYFHMDWARGTWDQRVMGGLLFIPALAAVTIAGIGSIQGCSRRENPQARRAEIPAVQAPARPSSVPPAPQSPPVVYGPPQPPGTHSAFPQPIRAREGDPHFPTLHWIQQPHSNSESEMARCDEFYQELVGRDNLRIELSIRNFLKLRGAGRIVLENDTEASFNSFRSQMLALPNVNLLARIRAVPPNAQANHFFAPFQEDGNLLGFYASYGGALAYYFEQPSAVTMIPIEDGANVSRARAILSRLGDAAFRDREFMGLMRDREVRAFQLMNDNIPSSSTSSSPDYYWPMGAGHQLRGGSAEYSGRGDLIDEAQVRRFRGPILTYNFYDAESQRVTQLRLEHCR